MRELPLGFWALWLFNLTSAQHQSITILHVSLLWLALPQDNEMSTASEVKTLLLKQSCTIWKSESMYTNVNYPSNNLSAFWRLQKHPICMRAGVLCAAFLTDVKYCFFTWVFRHFLTGVVHKVLNVAPQKCMLTQAIWLSLFFLVRRLGLGVRQSWLAILCHYS